jgi:hypothetical protein
MTATFVRYEILRNFRNWKFVFFSTAWPLILYIMPAWRWEYGCHSSAGGWPPEAWIVIAAWTAVLVPATIYAYRHGTSRA